MLILQGPQPSLPGNRFPVVSHFLAAYCLEVFRSTAGKHGQAIFNSGVLLQPSISIATFSETWSIHGLIDLVVNIPLFFSQRRTLENCNCEGYLRCFRESRCYILGIHYSHAEISRDRIHHTRRLKGCVLWRDHVCVMYVSQDASLRYFPSAPKVEYNTLIDRPTADGRPS